MSPPMIHMQQQGIPTGINKGIQMDANTLMLVQAGTPGVKRNLDTYAVDSSGNFTFTGQGPYSQAGDSKFGPSFIDCQPNQYPQMTTVETIGFGTSSSYTLDFWVKVGGAVRTRSVIFDLASTYDFTAYIANAFSIYPLALWLRMHGKTLYLPIGAYGGQWLHVAILRASNHNFRVYFNGVEVHNSSIDSTWRSVSAGQMTLFDRPGDLYECNHPVEELHISHIERWLAPFDVQTWPYHELGI